MFKFGTLNGFLYVGDFLFLASLATIIIKLLLEKSSQGFSAKTQGVYGVVLCTRNIDLLFVEGSAVYLIYSVFKKITNISCIIYIVLKIKATSKNNTTCNCNQDSFWVEALVIPCIIITAVFHYGSSPEEVLWSFSTYLEAVAMVPQLYLIQVRGKGDSYLTAYIALMATYTLTDTMVYCLNSFMYDNMPAIWPACKCLQLTFYIWYIIIPRDAVLPVANCEERKRRTTVFMRQQSMLAQTLLKKNNSASDLQIFTLTSPKSSASLSMCSAARQTSLEKGSPSIVSDTPPASPCIKFDPRMETESFRLRAPRLNIRQLKNKGTLKLTSLPSSPQFRRKANLRPSSSVASFRSINAFTQFETAMSSRSKRMFKSDISLPNSPDADRKQIFNLKPALLNRSISEYNKTKLGIYKGRSTNPNIHRPGISAPTTPESLEKSELILRPPLTIPSYRCHSNFPLCQPYKICPHEPSLPSVQGSPSITKKNYQDANKSLSSKPPNLPSPEDRRQQAPIFYLPSEQKTQLPPSFQEKSAPTRTLDEGKAYNGIKEKKHRGPPLPKLNFSMPKSSGTGINSY